MVVVPRVLWALPPQLAVALALAAAAAGQRAQPHSMPSTTQAPVPTPTTPQPPPPCSRWRLPAAAAPAAAAAGAAQPRWPTRTRPARQLRAAVRQLPWRACRPRRRPPEAAGSSQTPRPAKRHTSPADVTGQGCQAWGGGGGWPSGHGNGTACAPSGLAGQCMATTRPGAPPCTLPAPSLHPPCTLPAPSPSPARSGCRPHRAAVPGGWRGPPDPPG